MYLIYIFLRYHYKWTEGMNSSFQYFRCHLNISSWALFVTTLPNLLPIHPLFCQCLVSFSGQPRDRRVLAVPLRLLPDQLFLPDRSWQTKHCGRIGSWMWYGAILLCKHSPRLPCLIRANRYSAWRVSMAETASVTPPAGCLWHIVRTQAGTGWFTCAGYGYIAGALQRKTLILYCPYFAQHLHLDLNNGICWDLYCPQSVQNMAFADVYWHRLHMTIA